METIEGLAMKFEMELENSKNILGLRYAEQKIPGLKVNFSGKGTRQLTAKSKQPKCGVCSYFVVLNH